MTREAARAANDLGKAQITEGRRDEAAVSFRRAVNLDPDFAEAHNNLGNILSGRSGHDESIAAYRRAIALSPTYVEAYFNLGHALRRKGDARAAIDAYRRALALRPDFIEACNGLGHALIEAGQQEEALTAFRRAVALRPEHGPSANNLALALHALGRRAAALEILDQALAFDPGYAFAHANRGMILKDMRDHDGAVLALRRALALRPDVPAFLARLVHLLRELGRVPDAIAACHEVLDACPSHAAALGELAELLRMMGRIDEAHAACMKALAIGPDDPELLNVLGNIRRDQGALDDAIGCFRAALERRPDAIGIRSNLVFTLQFASGTDAPALLAEARRWAELHEQPLLAAAVSHVNARTVNRVLRVGYVTGFFRLHSAAFFLMPLLAHHDPGQVKVFCYSGVREADDVTRRFQLLGHAWRDTAGLTDAELAELVRTDEIDILVDVTLHMQDSRLLAFARRPAPVQVTWLGYPGTTGLNTIDYRLTDPILDPPGQNDDHYAERSIRLPRSFWCYAPVMETPAVNVLPALACGYVTFGCLNNFHKVTADTLGLWSRVLASLPQTRLVLLCPAGAHRGVVYEQLAQSGVVPGRVMFVDRLPLEAYFQAYQQIDICLDTTPYPGHTKTLDSLWMGVPVVTLEGQTVVGRGGASILTNLDLQHLIARTPEEYVANAQRLCEDLGELNQLRQELRGRLHASALMDGTQFASDVESAYAQMWRTYCCP